MDAWGVKSKIGEIYAVGEDDLEEVTDIPKIVLKSGKNNNTYSLFNDRIVIKGKTETTIDLPKSQDIICFSDMYYENETLSVFVATTEGYDKRYCLDEDLLTLEEKGWSKKESLGLFKRMEVMINETIRKHHMVYIWRLRSSNFMGDYRPYVVRDGGWHSFWSSML